MLLKDVKVGEVYCAKRYGRATWPHRDSGSEWEELARYAHPVKVLEAPADVPGYSRRGALVQQLNPQTMEPQVYDSGPVAPVALMAVQLLGPWEEFHRRYHERLDAIEQAQAEAAERRRVEQERRQEEGARRWMANTFAQAKLDIEQVMEVVNGEPGRRADDDEVRALVALRYPDGNPYLNGSRTVH